VPQIWTVKDREGHVLPCFTAASRLEVERKLVPTHYDAFRLHVSSSYRELFARELAKILASKDWRVVPIRKKMFRRTETKSQAQIEFKLAA
jgi:hypothetical protein